MHAGAKGGSLVREFPNFLSSLPFMHVSWAWANGQAHLIPFHCPETLHFLVSLTIHAGACPEEGCAWFGVDLRARQRNVSWKRMTEQKATFTFTQGAGHGQRKYHNMDTCVTLVTSQEITTAVLPGHGVSASWDCLPGSLSHTKFADLVPVIAPGRSGGDETRQETLLMATAAGTVSGYEEATLWCGFSLCSSIR